MSLSIEKCLQAWTNSLRQMKVQADVVFFGDSLTYYGDFARAFPNKVVCNLGLRGDTIQGMIDRVAQVGILKPKEVYLMSGINDIACCAIDEFEQKYLNLVNVLKGQVNGMKLIVQSIIPVNDIYYSVSCNNVQIVACNEVIKKIAARSKLMYCDLFSIYAKDGCLDKSDTIDGVHLKQEAYHRWIEVLMASQ